MMRSSTSSVAKLCGEHMVCNTNKSVSVTSKSERS